MSSTIHIAEVPRSLQGLMGTNPLYRLSRDGGTATQHHITYPPSEHWLWMDPDLAIITSKHSLHFEDALS